MSYTGPMIQAPQMAHYAQTIQLDGVGPLFYYDSRVAQPGLTRQTIILVHGLQDEADSWRHVFLPLAQQARVLALDLPGFGRSDKSQRRYTLPFFADTVLRFMDALKIMHATLIGNSMGAMTAELVALMHPARVSRLVLIDGTLQIVERPRAAAGGLLQTLFPAYYNRKYFAVLRGDPQLAFDTLRPYYANLHTLPEADRDFLFQRVNERVWDEGQRLAALSVQMNMAPFFIGQLPRWQRAIVRSPVPTQVIWGVADVILTLRNGQARVAQQRLPTRFHVIPNSGHLPHQENPAAVLSVLTT